MKKIHFLFLLFTGVVFADQITLPPGGVLVGKRKMQDKTCDYAFFYISPIKDADKRLVVVKPEKNDHSGKLVFLTESCDYIPDSQVVSLKAFQWAVEKISKWTPKKNNTLSAEQLKAIDDYENGMKYITGHVREKFNYPEGMFKDIPNGNGKLRLAYFGARRPDLEQYNDPLIEVVHYAEGTPEAYHAQMFSQNGGLIQALGVDGLGRKITRYNMDPAMALQSLINDEKEPLRKYLEAKKAQDK